MLSTLVLSSCSEDEETESSYNQALLIGKWVTSGVNNANTLYYRYDSDGNGATWDTDDDVLESEAQAFTWTLSGSTLTQIHILEINGSGVPKVYTVTSLTSTSLVYKDDYGTSTSFTKVTE